MATGEAPTLAAGTNKLRYAQRLSRLKRCNIGETLRMIQRLVDLLESVEPVYGGVQITSKGLGTSSGNHHLKKIDV